MTKFQKTNLWALTILASAAVVASVLFIHEDKQCKLDTKGWATPRDGVSAFRAIVFVRVEGQKIIWNGVEIPEGKLQQYADVGKHFEPQSFVVFTKSHDYCKSGFEQRIQHLLHKELKCAETHLCGFGTKREWDTAQGTSSKFGVE